MDTPTSEAVDADGLFDKYLLPKAALTVILAASLVGTAVSLRLSTGWDLPLAVVKWGYFVSLGTLTGGYVWKHGFVRPADLDADGYCRRMYDRFDRIALGAVAALAVSAPVVVAAYLAGGASETGTAVLTLLLVAFAALVGVDAKRPRPVEARFRSPSGVLALGLGVAAVLGSAWLDVGLTGRGGVAVVVRALHLLAVAVWVGGAVWNIFAAVPSGQTRPTTGTIRAAGEQLERFRWAVRLVIPTLVLTGLHQAVDALGVGVRAYLGSLVGLAILAKVGLVALLVGIFLTCPMWRACSPIDGVCDLDDLGTGSSTDGAASTDGGVSDDD